MTPVSQYIANKTSELKSIGATVTLYEIKNSTNEDWRRFRNIVLWVGHLAISSHVEIRKLEDGESELIEDNVYTVLDFHPLTVTVGGRKRPDRFVCTSTVSIVDAVKKARTIIDEWIVEKESELQKERELRSLLGYFQ